MTIITLNPKLSKTKRSMLNIAVKAAGSSEQPKQHGAVIVKSGSVLSIGVNKQRNVEMIRNATSYPKDSTVHAEIDALSRTTNPVGATIYIARVNKQGEERYSAPCDSCAEALQAAGIKKIIYTAR